MISLLIYVTSHVPSLMLAALKGCWSFSCRAVLVSGLLPAQLQVCAGRSASPQHHRIIK